MLTKNPTTHAPGAARAPRARRSARGWLGATLVAASLAAVGGTVGVAPAGAASLTIRWDYPTTDGQIIFKLERKIGTDGQYAQIATLRNPVTSFTDTTVAIGTTYCYQVRAANDKGESPPSNEDCGTPGAGTAEPTPAPGTGTAEPTPAPGAGPSVPTPAPVTGTSGPTPAESGEGGGGGGCFIATAAFGSPLAPQVQRLREVRDRYLLLYAAGRAFVRWYYSWSPALAETLGQSAALRAVTRAALLPALGWAKLALWSPTRGWGLPLVPLVGGLWLARRRTRRD